MKKLFFLIALLCFSTGVLVAQDEENPDKKKKNSDEIQTIAGDISHHGFHWGFSFTGTNIGDANEPALLIGGRLAWTINRVFALGFEGKGLIPSVTINNISPDYQVRPLMGYGGFFIEPILFSNKVVHATIPIATGSGWVGYVRDWNDERHLDLDDSGVIDQYIFWYFEPGANVEVNITRYFRVAAGVSYRYLPDFDLLNSAKKDFVGMNYSVMLKFGRF